LSCDVLLFRHYPAQDLACFQCTIRVRSCISPGYENAVIPIDRYQAVGLVVHALSVQHDVSPSQILGRDRLDVENFPMLDCRLHASAVRAEPNF
jgi:hypothetical protein